MDRNRLLSIDNGSFEKEAEAVSSEDINQLVSLLDEKDNVIRCQALHLLMARSRIQNDVYPFWDTFKTRLESKNSYQRSIGLMLIANNARWDKENKTDIVLEQYMKAFSDEKPITARQCIQSLEHIVPFKKHLQKRIAKGLMAVPLTEIRETMRKLILTDILNILILMRKDSDDDKIGRYIVNALSGGILDEKTKKTIRQKLEEQDQT